MESKITTNSQLSTTEHKAKTKKLSKLEQEQNHRNGDHMEGYQQGRGKGENEGKGAGNKKHNWQAKNRWGEVENGIGNREVKELVCI